MESRESTGLEPARVVGSAALIAAGAMLEPELLGGALLGAGVIYGFPLIGRVLRPAVNTAMWLGYSAVAAVSEIASQAGKQIQSSVDRGSQTLQLVGKRYRHTYTLKYISH